MRYLEYLILESLNPEDIYKKYYTDIPEDIFLQIISADPTSILNDDSNKSIKKIGRYSKWMLKLYKEKKLLLEDLYKFTRTLNLFHTLNVRGILKKNNIPADINFYKDLPNLWSTIKEFYDEESSEVLPVNSDEYEIFWNNDKCRVIIPLTHKASCYFGVKSDWCTSNEDPKFFNEYSKDGPLFIILDKNDSKIKYQFHLQTESFADINDKMLSNERIHDILSEYNLSDDFIKKVLIRSKIMNPITMRVDLPYISFVFAEDLYIEFKSYTDFHDYISSDFEYTDVYDILDEDENWDKYVESCDIQDIVSADVNYKVLYKVLEILKDLDSDIYESEDFQYTLSKIENMKSMYIGDILELVYHFEDEHDVDEIKNAFEDAYSEIRAQNLFKYYQDYIRECISYEFSFKGAVDHSWSTRKYFVSTSMGLDYLFVNILLDSSNGIIDFYPDDDPDIEIGESELSYLVIDKLNDI